MVTEYADNRSHVGAYDVVFLNKDGKKLVRHCASPYIASEFVRKVRRSKKGLSLVSYPILK